MNLANQLPQKLRQMVPLALLLAIFLLSWWIRAAGNQPDRLLSFDPIFQYRFTRYFAEYNTLPAWDELSYYTGRAVAHYPPLIFYLTTAAWWIMRWLGWSLMTTAAWASAIYGAAIVIPAYLLARSLSNRWGGLLAAVLVGTAPQILSRTFGASFDTDQLALFFILLTLWAGVVALKNRTPASFCLLAGSFITFSVAWQMYWFTFFTLVAVVMLFTISVFLKQHGTTLIRYRISQTFRQTHGMIVIMTMLFATLLMVGQLLDGDPLGLLFGLFGFAQHAETWIVNISIAELQLVDIVNPATWVLATGRLATGDNLIDSLMLLILFGMLLAGLVSTWLHNRFNFAVLVAISGIGLLSVMRGIRFTEFSSALLLVGVGIGWGYLVIRPRDQFIRSVVIGFGIMAAVVGISLGLHTAQFVGPDISPNWENAWAFLRSTPETSLVGTWWDPGHMITGLGERRVIADGAHCGHDCLYTINDRITDLGKIFNVDSEDEALKLLRKYKGTSSNIYWIASDDLIGKFQWLQYFGTGCDARTEARCPLFVQFGLQDVKQLTNGMQLNFGSIQILQAQGNLPVPIFIQGRSATVMGEFIYAGQAFKLNTSTIDTVRPLISELNLRLTNQTLDYSVSVSSDGRSMIIIPPHLRESLFVKIFFLEGLGLEHFKQVFRNEQVKIYEVEF